MSFTYSEEKADIILTVYEVIQYSDCTLSLEDRDSNSNSSRCLSQSGIHQTPYPVKTIGPSRVSKSAGVRNRPLPSTVVAKNARSYTPGLVCSATRAHV
jgi:hypothetical protein